ncbi:MaoC family dehydratase N-terminal domain-containing protein [Pseudonocardia sp. KRD-184]|uniref:MaoC family dehydratase N-terminal domain-containing protein n=1 Tax=Pseudonocardia oceani TaxID=2792013 RepID=A0ABS6U2T8_9PSEU|nr:MaoC family dehydratase N-terminal domain-containing protein [Pseudonocardia oceani]MBW0089878.1 MaoC family dehydratase N-terminal domain-containing protein [Pseudonocardia oceani]MBW0095618.1 MaoC family dehydratase N-terminal domain-containing protein [Pseudonocardia oceani]MBW0107840.1 MaoC family dehydratase N-terminal domain-containing protein [Pseudonocardia oceani]MBW0122245.1 MaoC family dehydratase N-terminal domain-containing protein [Pseudonocardia oceani]MBW0126311.1 MaoC famil
MADGSLTGRGLGTVTFPVDRSKVREFARALGDPDPVYTDVDAARAAGFGDIPVPPTFVVSSAHWREEDNMVATLGLDLRRVLHGECGWEYHGPVVVGDELTASRRVSGVSTREGRRGGTMTMVSIETDFTNQRGELVVRQTDVLVETGG